MTFNSLSESIFWNVILLWEGSKGEVEEYERRKERIKRTEKKEKEAEAIERWGKKEEVGGREGRKK